MKPHALLAIAPVLLVACSHKPPPDPLPQGAPAPFVYEPPPNYPPIEWINSIAEARARAADEHKPLIVFVRAAWAKGSVDMDSTVWSDARVLKEAPRFVALRVDVTESYAKDKKMPPALADFVVETIPTTIVVTSDGRVTGRFAEGTAHAADVAKAMREAK